MEILPCATAWQNLRGLLPPLFAVAMGWTIGVIQHGGDRNTPLAVIGVLFILLQILPPLHHATGSNLGSRTAAQLRVGEVRIRWKTCLMPRFR